MPYLYTVNDDYSRPAYPMTSISPKVVLTTLDAWLSDWPSNSLMKIDTSNMVRWDIEIRDHVGCRTLTIFGEPWEMRGAVKRAMKHLRETMKKLPRPPKKIR